MVSPNGVRVFVIFGVSISTLAQFGDGVTLRRLASD